MSKSAIETLRETVRGTTQLNAPMQTLTSIRIGGPADILIRPADREDLSEVLKFLHSREIAVQPLGNGSATLVRDNGIRGAVVDLREGFTGISAAPDWTGAPRLKAEAGVQLSDLTEWCMQNGMGGLEFLSGIPGTVGGAVVMNAQGWGGTVGDRLIEVEAMDPMGNIHTLDKSILNLGKRSSKIAAGFTIISAIFRGDLKEPSQVETMVRNFAIRRRSNYPTTDAALGMVFRDVGEDPVEKLIEACGLKGIRVGDAEVSRLNSNFIVNLGHAEAGNVVSLIGMIQERVYVRHKIKLETAITIVGSWQKDKMRIKH